MKESNEQLLSPGSYALSQLDFPVVGVASTIYNNLYGSEITIGVDKDKILKKRILFLISDTDGGHRTSAQAMAEAIEFRYPEQFEVIAKDLCLLVEHGSGLPGYQRVLSAQDTQQSGIAVAVDEFKRAVERAQ